jgi:hypothetical protein
MELVAQHLSEQNKKRVPWSNANYLEFQKGEILEASIQQTTIFNYT